MNENAPPESHDMTPDDALHTSRDYLDEATENMTFEAFGWTLEETWRGVAWALEALTPSPLDTLDLGAKGALPRAGSLTEVMARVHEPPSAAVVVERLEALRATLEAPEDAPGGEVEACVFAAWELYDACAWRLQLIDTQSDGAQGRRGVERRAALKMLFTGAGGVLGLAACTKPEPTRARASHPGRLRRPKAPGVKEVASAKVAKVEALRAMQWPTDDPFLFCAYHLDDYPEGDANFGPAASLEGRHLGRDFEGKDNWRMYHGRTVPGFPRHPHRGFETVTVVRKGMLDHSDSMGATARYGGGDVQWLTAGGGIQHAEMFPLLRSEEKNPLELFQIWLNLPRANKMVPPHFTMLWNEHIPKVTVTDDEGRDTVVTVAAGRFGEHAPPAPPPNSWASDPDSDLAIWTLEMAPNARITLPPVREGTRRSIYVHRGQGATVGDKTLGDMHRAVVEDSGELVIEAGGAKTEILLLQAKPIAEPVAKRGPFVMNTHDEIRQAYSDYQRTQFGGWPWSGNGPVHPGTKGRFARLIDGTLEEPT